MDEEDNLCEAFANVTRGEFFTGLIYLQNLFAAALLRIDKLINRDIVSKRN